MRLRTVISNVPGGVPFRGLVASQYHFGQSTGGGFTGFTFFTRFGGLGSSPGAIMVQSSWESQGSGLPLNMIGCQCTIRKFNDSVR